MDRGETERAREIGKSGKEGHMTRERENEGRGIQLLLFMGDCRHVKKRDFVHVDHLFPVQFSMFCKDMPGWRTGVALSSGDTCSS